MPGYPSRDESAPAVNFAFAHVRSGAQEWRWTTEINGKTVEVSLPIATLRTVANRAAHNKNGRASQSGLAAKVLP